MNTEIEANWSDIFLYFCLFLAAFTLGFSVGVITIIMIARFG